MKTMIVFEIKSFLNNILTSELHFYVFNKLCMHEYNIIYYFIH